MKQKLHFIAIILIALSTPVRAYDFYDVTLAGDTLYYNVISGDAWVTYDNIDFADYPIFVAPNGGLINEQGLPVGTYQNLSGNLVIPSSVSNEFGEVFNVVGIDHYAFYGCHGLISVTMPATITQMGMNAFERCPNLVSVQLSSSLEAINVQDFQHCKSLSTINIPNTCTSIGTNAFLGCSSLASLVIPNSVISIGDLAFGDCTALASLNIGSGITDLNYAFSGCTGLTSISVAGNNPIFDSRNNCNAVIETYTNTLVLGCRTTIIPNSVTAIGGMAFRTSPDTVVIPEGVTTIEWNTFSWNTELKAVVIPNTVTSIGDGAFIATFLDSIHLPASIVNIGDYAFGYCDSLKSITVDRATPPTLGEYVFYSNYDDNFDNATLIDVPVRVPVGSVPAYRADPAWNVFSVIIEGDSTYSPSYIANLTLLDIDTIETNSELAYFSLELDNITNPSISWNFEGAIEESIGSESYGSINWGYAAWSQPGTYAVTASVSVNGVTDSRTTYITVVEPCHVSDYPYTTDFESGMNCWKLMYGWATLEDGTVRLSGSNIGWIKSPVLDRGEGEYQISFRAKSSVTTPQPLCLYMYRNTFHDYRNNAVSEEFDVSSTDWTNYTFTIPANVERINFGYLDQGNGDVWIDDIVISLVDSNVTPSCDTIVHTLPYYADFTQCWESADGAETIDADTVLFSHYQQSITSPLIQADSDTYIHFSFDASNPYNLPSETNRCARILIRIYAEGDNNPILSETRYQNVGDNVDLKVPSAGNFRVVLSHVNGDWSNNEFRIVRFWADSYPWTVEMQAPDTAYLYHQTTFIASATLPDATESISYTWNIRNNQYNGDTVNLTFTSGYGTSTIILYADSRFHGRKEVQKYPFSLTTRSCTGNPITQFPYTQDFEYGTDCWQLVGNSYVGTLNMDGGAHSGNNFYHMWRYSNERGTLVSPTLELDSMRYTMSFYARQQHSSKLNVLFGRMTDTITVSMPISASWTMYEVLVPEYTTWVGFNAFDGQNVNGDNASVVDLDDITIAPIGYESTNNVIVRDTVIYNITYLDSTVLNIQTIDSTVYNVTTVDSTVYNVVTVDSVVYNITNLDSVVYNINTVDSVVVNIIQSDSIIYFYDTTCATHDTVTLTEYLHDTITVTLYDTVTITVHDTIYIHDSVGVDPVSALPITINVSGGAIVVDGAEGRNVQLYDAVGRLIATRQNYAGPVRFDIAASGTYLVKVDGFPARKVVAVR